MRRHEHRARSQIHHPLPGLDASSQLGGVCHFGSGQINAGGTRGIGRTHVCVVSGEDVESGEDHVHEIGLRLGQGWVGLTLLLEGGLRAARLNRRAE